VIYLLSSCWPTLIHSTGMTLKDASLVDGDVPGRRHSWRDRTRAIDGSLQNRNAFSDSPTRWPPHSPR